MDNGEGQLLAYTKVHVEPSLPAKQTWIQQSWDWKEYQKSCCLNSMFYICGNWGPGWSTGLAEDNIWLSLVSCPDGCQPRASLSLILFCAFTAAPKKCILVAQRKQRAFLIYLGENKKATGLVTARVTLPTWFSRWRIDCAGWKHAKRASLLMQLSLAPSCDEKLDLHPETRWDTVRMSLRLDRSQLRLPKKSAEMGKASERLVQVGSITMLNSGDSIKKGLLPTDYEGF